MSQISLDSGQFAFVQFQVDRNNAVSGEQFFISVIITEWSQLRRSLVTVLEQCEAKELETKVKSNRLHEAWPVRQKWVGTVVFKITYIVIFIDNPYQVSTIAVG